MPTRKMLQKTVGELQERIKELECLYAVSALTQRKELSGEDVFREAAGALTRAYQYPDRTRVRITLEGQVRYPAGDLDETPWRQVSPVTVGGRAVGALEVFCDEARPFLKEEQALLDAVARMLGNYIETQREHAARQASEASAHMRELEFRTLAEHSPDIIARFDRDLRHVYINPAIEQFTGRPWQSFLGRTNAELGMPDDLVAIWNTRLHGVFETGCEQKVEFRFPAPDGNDRYFENHLIPEVGAGGQVETVLCVVHELTERVEEELKLIELTKAVEEKNEELACANERLEAINAELEKFASVVSHDLKAPLRAVHGLSEWLEEEISEHLSGEGCRRMQLLRDRISYMDDLIGALLDYSRSGGRLRNIEEVDTGTLVQEVVDVLSVPDGYRISPAPDLPRFQTDRTHLQQVFANLIGNAVDHHHRPDGHVWISARDLGESFEFSVADDGPGIPPQHHRRIFDVFCRLDPSKGAGTGIGLAVVRKIVESVGGKITVESDPGTGTTFRFTWPKVIVSNPES